MNDYALVSNVVLPIKKYRYSFDEILNLKDEYRYIAIIPDVLEFCSNYDIASFDVESCCEYFSNFYFLLKARFSSVIIWFSCINPFEFDRKISGYTYSTRKRKILELNNSVFDFLSTEDIFVDFEELLLFEMKQFSYNLHNFFRWKMPYDSAVMEVIQKEVERQIKINNHTSPKALILDCDGVLWGDVVTEEGIEGILFSKDGAGGLYYAFQLLIKRMFERGVILSICTKNEYSDIEDVFNKKTLMPLQLDDFVIVSASMAPKSFGVKKIIECLNISEEDIVYIDDTETEIREVKTAFPSIKAICFNPNTVWNDMSCFNLPLTPNIEDVRIRNDSYKSNMKRIEIRNPEMTIGEFRKLLKIETSFELAEYEDLSRISELSGRANKLTNGKRFNMSQLVSIFSKGKSPIIKVTVSDKFGSIGLVGAMIISGDYLELFVLSCRAAGRGVEVDMIEEATRMGINHYYFSSTGKNGNIKSLLDEHIGKLHVKTF